MSIKHRLTRLERLAMPEKRTTLRVHMPGVTGTEEEIEAELAEAGARGEKIGRLHLDSRTESLIL